MVLYNLVLQKIVEYGCAGLWNFGRNTAAAVPVQTLCMKIMLFKMFNDILWKLCSVQKVI